MFSAGVVILFNREHKYIIFFNYGEFAIIKKVFGWINVICIKMYSSIKENSEIPNFLYNRIVFAYRKVRYGKNLDIRGRVFCVKGVKGVKEIKAAP